MSGQRKSPRIEGRQTYPGRSGSSGADEEGSQQSHVFRTRQEQAKPATSATLPALPSRSATTATPKTEPEDEAKGDSAAEVAESSTASGRKLREFTPGRPLFPALRETRSDTDIVSMATDFVAAFRADHCEMCLHLNQLFIHCTGVDDDSVFDRPSLTNFGRRMTIRHRRRFVGPDRAPAHAAARSSSTTQSSGSSPPSRPPVSVAAALASGDAENVLAAFADVRARLARNPLVRVETCPLLKEPPEDAENVCRWVGAFLETLVVLAGGPPDCDTNTLEVVLSLVASENPWSEYLPVQFVEAFFTMHVLAGMVQLDSCLKAAMNQARQSLSAIRRETSSSETGTEEWPEAADDLERCLRRVAALSLRNRQLGLYVCQAVFEKRFAALSTNSRAFCVKMFRHMVNTKARFFVDVRFRGSLAKGLSSDRATERICFMSYLRNGLYGARTERELNEISAQVRTSLDTLVGLLRTGDEDELAAVIDVFSATLHAAPSVMAAVNSGDVEQLLAHKSKAVTGPVARLLYRWIVVGGPGGSQGDSSEEGHNSHAVLCQMARLFHRVATYQNEDRVSGALASTFSPLTDWETVCKVLLEPSCTESYPATFYRRHREIVVQAVTSIGRLMHVYENDRAVSTAPRWHGAARSYLGEHAGNYESGVPAWIQARSRESARQRRRLAPGGIDKDLYMNFTWTFGRRMNKLCQNAWDEPGLLAHMLAWPQYFHITVFSLNQLLVENLLAIIKRVILEKPPSTIDSAVETLFVLCSSEPVTCADSSITVKDEIEAELVQRLQSALGAVGPSERSYRRVDSEQRSIDSYPERSFEDTLFRVQRVSCWFEVLPLSLADAVYSHWAAGAAAVPAGSAAGSSSSSSRGRRSSSCVQLAAFAVMAQSLVFSLARVRHRASGTSQDAALLQGHLVRLLEIAPQFLSYPACAAVDAFVVVYKLLQAASVHFSENPDRPVSLWTLTQTYGRPLITAVLVDAMKRVVEDVIVSPGRLIATTDHSGSLKPYLVPVACVNEVVVELYCLMCVDKIIDPVHFDLVLRDYVEKKRYEDQIWHHAERLKHIKSGEGRIAILDSLGRLYVTLTSEKARQPGSGCDLLKLSSFMTRFAASFSPTDRDPLMATCSGVIDVAGHYLGLVASQESDGGEKWAWFLTLFRDLFNLVQDENDLSALDQKLSTTFIRTVDHNVAESWEALASFRELLKRC